VLRKIEAKLKDQNSDQKLKYNFDLLQLEEAEVRAKGTKGKEDASRCHQSPKSRPISAGVGNTTIDPCRSAERKTRAA
jgi:hypothetical protein